LHYRALAIEDRNDFVWFWIGSHADYDHLVERKKVAETPRSKRPRRRPSKPRK